MSELQIRGQRYRRSTRTASKREAAIIETRWKAELIVGHTDPCHSAQVRMLTLSEAVDRYYNHELAPRQQKPRTARVVRYNLSFLTKHFGPETPLDQITTAAVAGWRASMLSKGLAPSTVNRRMTDLRAILRKAVRWGVLQSVPFFEACRLPAARDRIVTEEEYQRILAECPDHLRQLVVFLSGSGARLGEALELRWSHVAEDGSSVIFTQTKSGRSRCVPLSRGAGDMIQSLPRGELNTHVFKYDGRAYESPKTAWRKARKRAGLEWVRLHDMRHLAASRLVRKGVSLYVVQRYLGHASPVITQRYSHLTASDLAQAVALLD